MYWLCIFVTICKKHNKGALLRKPLIFMKIMDFLLFLANFPSLIFLYRKCFFHDFDIKYLKIRQTLSYQ